MSAPRKRPRLKAWLKRRSPGMPTPEQMAGNKWLAPIAHRFLSPELWRFTRRSVPRGVALGLFCAFIIPVGQIFLAAFLALPSRANVPISALATFITNPFTVPFWLGIAKTVGDFMLSLDDATGGLARGQIESGYGEWLAWLFETAAVIAFGFVVLAVVTSSVGYFVSKVVWRFIVARKRTRRLARMEASLDARLQNRTGGK